MAPLIQLPAASREADTARSYGRLLRQESLRRVEGYRRVSARGFSCFPIYKKANDVAMRETDQGRFLNPSRSPQLCEEIGGPATRYCNYGEWELPEGACAQMAGAPALAPGATIYFLPDLASRPSRIFVRFVWSEEAPDDINAAAPEER